MKVSVIVPTYRTSDSGLQRLLRSLDEQTMPAEDFEIIFVDDGSPDKTVDRLNRLVEGRSNVTIVRLQNSGWPSKPRNVGMDHARGEYVAFMDHDDELYPDGLRAAYEFAVLNHSDVVVGKEAQTDRVDWALDIFTEDMGQAVGRTDMHPLQPLNPHKLYRLAFLREHDIRFIEGRKVLWEDILFNSLVARHAKVISVLSSVPYYHWVSTKGSGTSQFIKWAFDYWEWMQRVLESTATNLEGEQNRLQRDQLMRHEYMGRILGTFDAKFSKRPAEARAFLFEQCRALQREFGLERYDSTMDASQRMRSFLLQRGEAELLARLGTEDAGVSGHGRARAIHWVNGCLHVSVESEWSNAGGRTFNTRRENGRIIKQFSAELNDALPERVRDMTSEVDSGALNLCLRSRTSYVTWLVPTTSQIIVDESTDGSLTFTGRASALIDPDHAAMGSALDSRHWDIFLQAFIGRNRSHRTLASSVPASISITNGRLHLVYPNDGGAATLIPDGQVEAVRRLEPTAARLTDSGDVELTLGGTHDGAGEVSTSLGIDTALSGVPDITLAPARLAVADGTAVLRFAHPGTSVRVRVGDRAPHGPALRTISLTSSGAHLDWSASRAVHLPRPSAPLPPSRRASGASLRILLLTDDLEDACSQLLQQCTAALIGGVMKNLGIATGAYTIDSPDADCIPHRHAIEAADLIVVGGEPFAGHSAGSPRQRTLKTLELADACGVPVLLSGIGAVPTDLDNESSRAIKLAISAPAVRQITTCGDLDALERYVEGTDIPIAGVWDPTVFSDRVLREHIAPDAKPQTDADTLVGLIVAQVDGVGRDGDEPDRLQQRRFWLDVIARLSAHGYDYRAFTTGRIADEVFLDELVRTGSIPAAKATTMINSSEELIGHLSACDGIVAADLRLSAVSYSLCVPYVGIPWSPAAAYLQGRTNALDDGLGCDTFGADQVVEALAGAISAGAAKDTHALKGTYDSLFWGIRNIIAPSSEKVPYSQTQLQKALPAYTGTSDQKYRSIMNRKLQRTFAAYRQLAYT